jgi:2-polyprenyl-3-methyl-5-hydroxy-6-metoxy-1,4-benzoquinol methylase
VTEPTKELFWESRYADVERVWSGRPNKTLVDVVSDVPAGRALDLGCGEGGDAIWLAGRGWRVTGVDISRTAITRAREAAAAAGIPAGRIDWQAYDLDAWRGEGAYDLVSACFLHSPVEIKRTAILRHAAGLVAPGGHLLIVSHADFPPWASDEHRHHEQRFLTPAEEIDALDLPPAEWEVVLAETREREATGPDGEQATLEDGVVLLSRRSTPATTADGP